MHIKSSIFVLVSALSFVACGNDGGGDVLDGGMQQLPDGGPDGGCNVEPNFTSLQTNLFAATSCARGGCHNQGAAGGLNLSGDKAAVHAALVNAPTAEPGTGVPTRVTPNDPQASQLYRKIADADPPGSAGRMPLGCDFSNPPQCLSECQITAVADWINAGAPND